MGGTAGKKPTETEQLFLDACRKRQLRSYWIISAVSVLIAFLMFTTVLGFLVRRERDRAEMNLQLAKRAVDESRSSAGRAAGPRVRRPSGAGSFSKGVARQGSHLLCGLHPRRVQQRETPHRGGLGALPVG